MLIERRGEKDFVKVCDFGIAKATLDEAEDDRSGMLTVQGLVCGTPEYMSPSRRAPSRWTGARTCIRRRSSSISWSRGTSRSAPNQRWASSPATSSSRRRLPATCAPTWPFRPRSTEIVLRGLEKNRELRFETAVAFREAIETMLAITSGAGTPLSPSARASMPTARDMARSPPTPIDTATVPARSAAERFATTANLTSSASGTRQKVLVIVGLVVLLGGEPLAAAITTGRAHRARLASTPSVAIVPRETPALPVAPAPPAAPTVAAAPVAAPPAAVPAAAIPVAALPARREMVSGKRRLAASHALPAALAGSAEPAKPAGAAPAPTPTPEAAAPPAPARGAREVLAEAEKLLGQGEVGDACARGEEASRIAPKSAPVHKFLGKCYMRAGRTREANDNYKLYLELAPNAADAPFVKSMIRRSRAPRRSRTARCSLCPASPRWRSRWVARSTMPRSRRACSSVTPPRAIPAAAATPTASR